MHFTCRSLIGKTTPGWWSQYWENEPDDDQKFTKGHLFGLISLESLDAPELQDIGRDIIAKINQFYFSLESFSVTQNLRQTLSHIQQHPEFAHLKINITLLIVVNQQSFFAALGDFKVILQRESKISQILAGSNQDITLVFGPIVGGDKLFIISQPFFDSLGFDQIKNFLLDTHLSTIEENFLSFLYSLDDQTGHASALIQVHQDLDIPIPTTDNPPPPPPPPPVSPPKDSSPSVYLRRHPHFKIGDRKKIQIAVALLLLLGLLVSFFFGYRKNQSARAESQFQSLKAELEKKLNHISVVKSLDLNTAYQTAKESKQIIQKMSDLNIHSDQVSQFQSQVDSVLSQTGDSDVFSPQMLYDTSLIVSQPGFSRIFFSQNNIYLLDPINGRIDSFDPNTKSTKNISLSSELKSAQKVLTDANNVYTLIQNQIKLVEKNSLTSKLDFSSHSSLNPTDVQFWNGSIYVLDAPSQSIWKFTPSASGFSSPQSWLKGETKLNLGTNSLDIDGRIWVLTDSGQISFYTSGVDSKFKSNQSLNFTQAKFISTPANSDYLVFSDEAKYIYTYKKTGEFNSKYNLGDLKLIDLTFDPAAKTIYFLAGDQKIYKITL